MARTAARTRGRGKTARKPSNTRSAPRRWSARVTRTSNALPGRQKPERETQARVDAGEGRATKAVPPGSGPLNWTLPSPADRLSVERLCYCLKKKLTRDGLVQERLLLARFVPPQIDVPRLT
jgi:hypothetical protein